MLIFSISFPDLIIFLTLWIPLKEGFGVKGGPKTGRVASQIIFIFTFTLTHPKPFKGGHVSVFDKIFTLAKCKCKKIERVNDLHLHWI